MSGSARTSQLRPQCPDNIGMTTLNPSAFETTLPLLAVRAPGKDVGTLSRALIKNGDGLNLPGIKTVNPDKEDPKYRTLLLSVDDVEKLLPESRKLLEGYDVRPYQLDLTYDFWSAQEIIRSVLPEELRNEIPQSFAKSGHLIHVNLRDRYLPYKHAIAQALMDKNPGVRTVVNKIETINESEFRTFPMEVLAGEENFEVTVSESGCDFSFDFSKVYWNSRLSHEHERLIALFSKGDIVADVMAGVGPFAVPAAKRGVFVFANDLNPDSARWMELNRRKNGVSDDALRISCLDGKEFIQSVVKAPFERPFQPRRVNAKGEPMSRRDYDKETAAAIKAKKAAANGAPESTASPASSSSFLSPSSLYVKHFVMNLPASAVTFLGAFRGSYRALNEQQRQDVEMPIVHCHYFNKEPLPADHTDEKAEQALVDLASHYLGHQLDPSSPGFYIHKVRLVAPNKWMYCLGFQLPREVAFAED